MSSRDARSLESRCPGFPKLKRSRRRTWSIWFVYFLFFRSVLWPKCDTEADCRSSSTRFGRRRRSSSADATTQRTVSPRPTLARTLLLPMVVPSSPTCADVFSRPRLSSSLTSRNLHSPTFPPASRPELNSRTTTRTSSTAWDRTRLKVRRSAFFVVARRR